MFNRFALSSTQLAPFLLLVEFDCCYLFTTNERGTPAKPGLINVVLDLVIVFLKIIFIVLSLFSHLKLFQRLFDLSSSRSVEPVVSFEWILVVFAAGLVKFGGKLWFSFDIYLTYSSQRVHPNSVALASTQLGYFNFAKTQNLAWVWCSEAFTKRFLHFRLLPSTFLLSRGTKIAYKSSVMFK